VGDLFPGIELPPPALAPDPEVNGFDNDAQAQVPSPLLVEQLRGYAQAVARAATAEPERLLACAPGEDERACGASFVRTFGARAFRRPLDDGELARFGAFLDLHRARIGLAGAVALVIEAMLQSPAFLYRIEPVAPHGGHALVRLGPYETASRLSYFLWASMPDDALFDAAARGALSSTAGIEAEARRMLEDRRARSAVLEFHRQWLDLDRVLTADKDALAHPEWNDALRRAMWRESSLFVEHVLFDGEGTVPALFTSRTALIDSEVAPIYGLSAPETGRAVELDAAERAGILTRAAFLAGHAHAVDPSPVRRGVTILRRVLCAPLPPPAPGVDTTPPPAAEGATNRERYEAHLASPSCAGCHDAIGGIGYGLEGYDAIGRHRETDGGRPVDDRGTLAAIDQGGAFEGGVELSSRLAASADVRRCVATQWLRWGLGRTEAGGDAPTLDALERSMERSGGDLRELLVALVTSRAFTHRRVEGDR
jgi:hypothetical protein